MLGVLASCCVRASYAANSHAIKTPARCVARGGPCFDGHLARISCRPTTLADNEQYDTDDYFGDMCRFAPVIQGRRSGPAQKREPPAR